MTSTSSPQVSSTGTRSGRLIAGGVVVLLGFLALAAVLWWAGGQREANNIASFARAPVGCDTTLDFERSGEFLVFVETTGTIDALAGQCDAERSYDRDPDADAAERLSPGLVLVDPDGNDVDITEAPGVSYDADGFVGTAAWTVDIVSAGDHVLTVASIGGDDFAIAVGRSPDEGVALLRWGAIAASIVALVAGGALLVAGSRRTLPAAPVSGPWVPDGPAWPSSPPGFPSPPPTTGAVGPPGMPVERPASTVPSVEAAERPTPSVDPSAASPWGPPDAPQ